MAIVTGGVRFLVVAYTLARIVLLRPAGAVTRLHDKWRAVSVGLALVYGGVQVSKESLS